MRLASVQFAKPVPVFGTSLRVEHFSVEDGWLIDTDARGVVLRRAANPEQNIKAVEAFRVVGVGYCEPVEVSRDEQAGMSGDGASVAGPALDGAAGGDGGSAAQAVARDPQPPQGRKTKARGPVKA